MSNYTPVSVALVLLLCLNSPVVASSKPYPTKPSMDRKCLYLAKQMNRIVKKLKKDPIDQRQLKTDLSDYQLEWREHGCDQGGKAVTNRS